MRRRSSRSRPSRSPAAGLNAVVRTVMTFLPATRLHGLDRVAGIDRPLESVGADHLQNFGDLRDVQLRRHARQKVFSAGRRRRQNGIVIAGERQDQRFHRLGDRMRIQRIVGDEDFLHPCQFRGRRRGAAATLPRDQHMHRGAQFRRRRHGFRGGVFQRTCCRVRR